MSGTSPHHNANPRPTNGLIITKEFSLSRLFGRSGAAASRVSWGNGASPRKAFSSLVALAIGLTIALGIAAPAAHAGNYVVRGMSAGIPSHDGWTAYSNSNNNNYVSTWSGADALVGGFSAPRTGFTPGEYVRWIFTSSGAPIGAFELNTSVSGLTGGDWRESVTTGPTALTHFNAAPATNHSMQTVWANNLNAHTLTVELRCAGPGTCYANGAELRIAEASFYLLDNVAPSATSLTGALTSNAVPLSGNADLSINATDDQAGVYRSFLVVDGVTRLTVPMGTNGGRCVPIDGTIYSFTQQWPCLASATKTLSFDTTTLSEGAHTFELVIEDAASNRTTAMGPVSRTVDNVPPPQNTSDPLITGLLRHGQTLAGDTGTWTGAGITYARQWQRYDTGSGTWLNIAGATGPTYAVQADDYGKKLRTRIRATNAEGTTDAYSEPVGPIASPTDPKGDFDGDGILNENDPDDDNDGVPDDGDANPHDPSVGAPPKGPGDTGGPVPGEGENGGGGSAGNGSGGGSGSGGGAGSGTGIRIETQNGEGPVATAALAASFEGTKSKTIKVKWGAKRKITGTLLGRDGQPVKGAKLDVHETPQLMGATAITRGQVVTDAKGRFSYQLPAGVSRTIRIAYKSILEASTYAQSTEVTVQVTPKVTMKANRKSLRNKQAVTFKGKIAGAPAGVRKIVEFQALDGKKWRTFASTRVAKKGGTFKYRYRFTRTTRTTKYQFRAIVRAEKGWPFVTGQTKPLHIKVRP